MRYSIISDGQFGNWMFRVAFALKLYGKQALASLIVRDYSLTQKKYKSSLELFSIVVPWLPVGAPEERADAIMDLSRNYYQDRRFVPTRDICREVFTVPASERVTAPVLHIRGDDYLRVLGPETVPGKSFVENAANRLGCSKTDFIVTTDDPGLAKQLGITEGQIHKGTPLEDFALMANAAVFVMSPSTFSWWAGFLGKHDRVLFPSGFGPWDAGMPRWDLTNAKSNAALCWGDECEMFAAEK